MIHKTVIDPSRISGVGLQFSEVHRMIMASRSGVPGTGMITLQTTQGVVQSEDPLSRRRNRLASSGGKVVPRWG